MKKIRFLLLLLIIILFPFNVHALNPKYKDKLYDIVDKEVEDGKINLYFFYGDGCPHCAKEEKFLDELAEKYKYTLNIYRFETWHDGNNKELMLKSKRRYNIAAKVSVPFTAIGDDSIVGYNDSIGDKIERIVIKYINTDEENEIETIVEENTEHIPLLGDINIKETSIFLVAIVLGLLDGFNPCAMWILLFLINMLFDMKNKKRMFLLGLTFLFVSGLVYFLSMVGITAVLSFISITFVRSVIGVIAVIAGLLNVKKFIESRKKDDGCHVVDAKKRKKILTRIKKFTSEENLFLALLGVIALAASVNLIELACSTVFPATFSEILAINNIHGALKIIYLIVYVVFYMLDDMIVFVISMCTLQIAAQKTKYGKYSGFISGLIMLLIGLLLIFKPEWIMFNF